MARKNLLKGLMEGPEKPNLETEKRPTPRYSKGAIGAVSQSIEELKSRSILEIDPFDIKAGGLSDRLEHDEADHAVLVSSIRDYGQQVPVLVRPDPETDGHYLIVYGRRRVAALRDLGLPAKAMVRNLDDRQAIMAQGQENSARRDLSFIERANFSRQMVENGYDRKVIADALSTDKTLISRFISVSEAVPVGLIEAIGAAPGIGRDRWTRFAKMWAEQDLEEDDGTAMLAAFAVEGSDARFDALYIWLTTRLTTTPPKTPKAGFKVPIETETDGTIGHLSQRKTHLRLDLKSDGPGSFAEWLVGNITEIHRDWKNQSGE